MKILYCITGLGIGGAEAITIDIANKMVVLGHQVVLMYLTGDNKQVARIGGNLQTIGLGMNKNPISFIKAQKMARKFILKWKPDVIHANMIHANIFCRFLRIHCSMPLLISSEHTNNVEGHIRMLMYRFTDFLSDLNTNVSEKAVRLFIQKKAFSQKKSLTVYNGVDLEKFRKCVVKREKIRGNYAFSEDVFLFFNVGRLMPAKDQKSLISAFLKLANIYSDIRLIIVGDGDLYSELTKYVQACKLEKKVLLVGSREDVVDYYSAADCFVSSSVWEGFGIVLAEAMACELPVIATDVGGCPEVINNPEFVVEPRNSEALFHKMKQVYEMCEEDREKLGRMNRETVKRFDIDVICQRWLKIYCK